MCNYQVEISKFEVHAPQYIHVEYVYVNKQLKNKISEYE